MAQNDSADHVPRHLAVRMAAIIGRVEHLYSFAGIGFQPSSDLLFVFRVGNWPSISPRFYRQRIEPKMGWYVYAYLQRCAGFPLADRDALHQG